MTPRDIIESVLEYVGAFADGADDILAALNRAGFAVVPRIAGMAMEKAGRREMGMDEWEGTASRVWAAMVAAAENAK